ncbi:DUF4390 domain-containing protein [Spirochaetota bacterium]
MKKYIIITLLMLSAALFALEIRLYPPKSFRIEDNKVYLACQTSKLFTEEVVNFINVGVTTTFTYYIVLYRKKAFIDPIIKEIIINKRVEYDIWSEIYQIEVNYPKKRKLYYRELDKLKRHITRLSDIYLIKQKNIDPKATYYFKTRMTLKITQLYSYMHLLYNFLSIFRYKTTFLKSKELTIKDFQANKTP